MQAGGQARITHDTHEDERTADTAHTRNLEPHDTPHPDRPTHATRTRNRSAPPIKQAKGNGVSNGVGDRDEDGRQGREDYRRGRTHRRREVGRISETNPTATDRLSEAPAHRVRYDHPDKGRVAGSSPRGDVKERDG